MFYFSLLIALLCPFKFSQKVSNYIHQSFLVYQFLQFLHNSILPFNIYFFLLGLSEPLQRSIQPTSLPLYLLEAELEMRPRSWGLPQRAGLGKWSRRRKNWWKGALERSLLWGLPPTSEPYTDVPRIVCLQLPSPVVEGCPKRHQLHPTLTLVLLAVLVQRPSGSSLCQKAIEAWKHTVTKKFPSPLYIECWCLKISVVFL